MEVPAEWQAWVTGQLEAQAARYEAKLGVLFEMMAAACEAAGLPVPGDGDEAPLAAAIDRARREGRDVATSVTIRGETLAVVVGPDASPGRTLEALRRAAEDNGS